MFKFGSWNVNNRRLRNAHIDILRGQNFDLLAMQEVSRDFHDALTKTDLFKWSLSSLAIRPPQADEGRARCLGVSVFGRIPFQLVSSEVLDVLDFPERALVTRTRSEFGDLTVCSFHIPPGTNWGEIKPQTVKAIATWLSKEGGCILLGIDANAPKIDHPSLAENKWWWADERLLLGPTPLHRLKDAFRIYLNDNPKLLDEILRERPNGPLEISHYRGRGAQRTACRYDFIFVSPDIRVERVKYIFDPALSDHALVVGHLAHLPGLQN